MRCKSIAIAVLVLSFGCGSDDSGGAKGDAGVAAGGSSGRAGTAGSSPGSGGSAGNVPPISTGLPANKKLNELTPAERQQACEKITGTVNGGSVTADYCKLIATTSAALAAGLGSGNGSTGASESELRSLCSAAYDGCVAQPPTTLTNCQQAAANAAMCTATVAEFEGCGTAEVKALHDAAANLPACAQLTQTSANAALVALGSSPLQATAAACNTFNQKCPGVLGVGP